MLVAEGLKLSFRDANGGAFRALDLPSFAPSAGAITAVRGPSGSGKSTLLYVLAGLLPPDHGAVRFGDVDIYGLGESRRDRWRREHIGFVFQDFHLLPELSPLANVAIAATFGGHGSNVAARSRQLLEKLGVPHSRRSVELLSRGERQRVAIARALLFDPPLILADEPTASLDDDAGVAVLDIFRGLARSGKTVVIATHDVKALSVAETTLVLEHGRSIEPRRAAA
jgi:putative ABC transport system ATP-binding protein